MRHLKSSNRRFGKSTAHRKAMLRNLVNSLIEHDRIVTTYEKAKELQKLADRMVTLGKKQTLHARRQALKVIYTKDSLHKLFTDLAERYKNRNGGYTRVMHIGNRKGDNAAQAIIEYVDNDVREKILKQKSEKERQEAEKKKEADAAGKD